MRWRPCGAILAANAEDLRAAEAKGIGSAMLDRLALIRSGLRASRMLCVKLQSCPIRLDWSRAARLGRTASRLSACACRWVSSR